MRSIGYRGYRFPPEIIQRAVWLYLRFTLSFRDVENLLAERGIIVTSGKRMYLWRAVDAEGEVLEVFVQAKRDTRAARRLMHKLLKKHGLAPTEIVTDRLGSYGAAFRELGLSTKHVQGKRKNNRAESSHLPIRRRERRVHGLPSTRAARRSLFRHAALSNLLHMRRHLTHPQT